MAPKRTPVTTTTVPGGALNGPTTASNNPKPTPVAGATSTVAPFNPSTVSTAPNSSASLFGLSTEEGSTLLHGDNTGLLGPDKNPGDAPRTILEAVEGLHSMSAQQIASIQQELINAGLLSGKYTRGAADSKTTTAFASAVKDSVRNGQSIGDYLGVLTNTGATDATSAAPAKPTYADPAQIATSLQSQFATYGLGNPTQADLEGFSKQITAAENAKPGTRTAVDVGSEAQLYAESIASKTPGATSKVVQSTDADITKAAATMGVELTPTARANIAATLDANEKATGSPDVNLLNQLVARQFAMPSDPSTLTGDAATVYNDIQKLAGQYLIPMGNASIGSWVTKAIKNQSYAGSLTGDTEAEVEQWLRQQSAVQYPWLAASTQNFQTVTPWDATSAYRTGISDTLQLGNPDAVNLLDPKYSKLLQPGANGAPPDLASMRQTLMTDPTYGYSSTPLALQQAYTLGVGILKGMGVEVSGA